MYLQWEQFPTIKRQQKEKSSVVLSLSMSAASNIFKDMTMTTISCGFLFILVLLISSSSAEENDICRVYLGTCTSNCDQQCKAAHPGGQGSCDYSVMQGLCFCNYPSSSPPPPTPPPPACSGNGGSCSRSCQDSCCSAKCAAKYSGGTGYCDSIGRYSNLCQCHYPCM